MRKQDYSILADEFRAEKDRVMHAWFDVEKSRTLTLESNARIAMGFANRAHVDKAAFLRACGISD